MADMHTPLMVRQIGEIEFDGPDGMEGVTGVLLQGGVAAIREVGLLFGTPVCVVSARRPSQDAETIKALRAELVQQRAYVQHWLGDVRGNLKPLESSLETALAGLSASLSASQKEPANVEA